MTDASSQIIEATISRCASGHDVWCIMLGDFRLFGGKCCGRWTIVRKYKTTLAELRDDIGHAVTGFSPKLSEREVTAAAAGIDVLDAGGGSLSAGVFRKLLDAAVKP